MPDLPTLSTLLSSATAQTAPPTAEALTWVPVTADTLPQTLETVTRQLQLTGTLLSLSDDQTATIQTAAGTLILSLDPTSLSTTAETQTPTTSLPQALTQALSNAGNAPTLIDLFLKPGTPPEIYLGLPTASLTTQEAPANLTAPTPALTTFLKLSPSETLTQSFEAVVLPRGTTFSETPLTASHSQPPAPPSLPTSLLDRVKQAFSSPSTSSSASPASPSPLLAPSSLTSSPLPPATKASLPSLSQTTSNETSLPEGTSLKLRFLPQDKTGTTQIQATVIGEGTEGQTILDTGKNLLFVKTETPLPTGTHVLLSYEKADGLLPSETNDVRTSLTFLDKTTETLTQTTSGTALEHFLQTRLPQANETLTSSLVYLLAALNKGDARAWLGESLTASLTANFQKETIDKISASLKESESTQEDGTVGLWRSWTIPLGASATPEQLTFAVHHPAQGSEERSEKKTQGTQTRFVISLTPTHLGPMQLDGLSRSKKLDMVIRSAHTLPEGTAGNLKALYLKTLEALGLTGTISFQTGQKNWLNLREKTEPHSLTT